MPSTWGMDQPASAASAAFSRHNMRRFLKHHAGRNGGDVSEVHETATASANAAVAAPDADQSSQSLSHEVSEARAVIKAQKYSGHWIP
eukprot:gene12000-15094_t